MEVQRLQIVNCDYTRAMCALKEARSKPEESGSTLGTT